MNIISNVIKGDALEYMRSLPDKFFDLAIADPPYGIGEDGSKNASRGLLGVAKTYSPYVGNDRSAPPYEFFEQLFRISKNQIIWGANHFIEKINKDSHCWIVWDKLNGETDFADCELAWTSFNSAVRKFSFRWQGMLQGDMKNKQERIHPNQKPLQLYSWLLDKFAKKGDKIFDPMMGSQSSRITAYQKGFDFWGCELDEYYFKSGNARFDRLCKGISKVGDHTITQHALF